MSSSEDGVESIAVIGLSVRVPDARTPDEYWRNICAKRESVTWFDNDELRAAGVPRGLYSHPAYVPAACVLPDADMFDAEFFGISHAEAAMLDPQHRLFLECAWEALEDAGHHPDRFDGTIGIYGGCFTNRYLLNLYANEEFIRSPAAYFARNYNDKDFLIGHAAYALNLRGPAVTIQTACSTSLVATHIACQSLLAHECDLALAGGVSVIVPLRAGYPALEGAMYTPEGRCRPFDAAASGTLPGSGGVMIGLRRLSDALADGDHIRAIIRGTAINNDGRNKVSFTAPNPTAQVELIIAAQTVAGVHPDTIGYVEAHATGTQLGDPIEVTALSEAFRYRSNRLNHCALGSVKANIGHLDAAAGAAGLARAVLALERKCIPPQANFAVPNPELKLDRSPFYVPTEPRNWRSDGTPRRAAVSSFAVGGTNAHAVLEEAPPRAAAAGRKRPHQLFVLSARDATALDAVAQRLADHLEAAPDQSLSDVAYTLAAGRAEFSARRIVVGSDRESTVRALRESAPPVAATESHDAKVVFMFPGVGTQYPDMALDIYDSEPEFRDQVDACASLLRSHLDLDIRAYLFSSRYPEARLDRESVPHVLAAIFTVEYALGKLWMSWGVRPSAMLGHSLGEYVAACMAGVLSLPDALSLTVRRGRIFDNIPEGRMMGVPLAEHELVPLLGDQLTLGAVNAPELCMVSGRHADLEVLRAKLDERGLQCRILPIRMASHSRLVDPYLDEFTRTVADYKLSPPEIPFLSCVSGGWIEAKEATSPAYWARQLRAPVQFARMVREAVAAPGTVLLEVGPGNTLTTLAAAQRSSPRPVAIPSLRHPSAPRTDFECLLTAVGRLWQAGVAPAWGAALGTPAPRRVPLPTYPFQRKRHWIAADRPIGPGSWSADVPDAAEKVASAGILVPDGADAPARPGSASMSASEQAIAKIWREHLGSDEIGLDDDFEALGGHSLLAAQMLPQLRQLSAGRLKVTDIFGAPTIRKLAALLDLRASAEGRAEPEVDLAAEVVLDPAIRAAGLPPASKELPDAILLTGGTGFLGTYLLAELLRQTTATIYCLVRATDATEGEQRLRKRFQSFGLPAPEAGRLVAIPGDLRKPRLGISGGEYQMLAERLGAIYHCGAWVNFARPYTVLKSANVGGTEEVLRLATRHRLKTVHHVSTLFVHMGSISRGVPFIGEDDPLPPPVGHESAYTESKWVAEGLCRIALERGVPVAIYRPANIFGDQRTGVMSTEDYFTKAIQGCVHLGLVPRRDWSIPIGTVDDVARMIILMSLRSDVVGRTFHLIHPEKLEWKTICANLRLFGYEMPEVSWEDWRTAFTQQLATGGQHALAPLADMISVAPADRTWPRFGLENTARIREDVGARYPVLDQQYFSTLFRYLIAAGLLPAPPRQGLQGTFEATDGGIRT